MGDLAPVALSELSGNPLEFDCSLFGLIEKGLEENGAREAIIVEFQSSEHGRVLLDPKDADASANSSGKLSWTYTQLHRASCRLALALQDKGVGDHPTIASLLPNSIEWCCAIWASLLLSATYSSMDTTACQESRVSELQGLLGSIKADVVFVQDAEAAKYADAAFAASGYSPKVKVVIFGKPGDTNWVTIVDLVAPYSADDPAVKGIVEAARDDRSDPISAILYTSGTSSGKPKGCPKSARAIIHRLLIQGHEFVIPLAKSLMITANFRAIAYYQTIMTFKVGGTIVLPFTAFEPGHMLEALARYRPKSMVLVPALFYVLRAHPSFESSDLSHLELVSIRGDLVTKTLYHKATEAFPTAVVSNAHGMTEGGAFFHFPYKGHKREEFELKAYGEVVTLGQIADGAKLKIVGDDGEPVPRGKVGELHACSGTLIKRYLNDEQPEVFYKDTQGRDWFVTGDSGLIDEEGYIYILGRSKDIVKWAGIPITPAALETTINVYTDTQCCVVAVPHEVLGEEPYAVVQGMGGKTGEEIKQKIEDSFGKDYELGGVATLEQLGFEGFPMNDNGKILKIKLKEPIKKHLGR